MLLLCPLEHGQRVLSILENLDLFKGRITLAVLEQNHSTPIEAVLRFLEPKMVIALDTEGVISSGDALILETQISVSSTGLEYQHGGEFAAWHSSLSLQGSHGSSVIGTIAASRMSAVVACHPREIEAVLQKIMT